MKLKKSKIKKLFMLTLPVAAISVVTPIVLTSCGSSSDNNTTNTSKVSWVDQTKSDFIFGPSGKQVTGSLTITNGKATLNLNTTVDKDSLTTAIADTSFATEIVKHMNIDPSISYKSSTFTSDDSSKNGNITVTLSNNQALSIDVINLKNTESTNQASWKDQTKSDFIFGPSGKQVTGSLTITNGKATLDLNTTVDKDSLTTAIADTSFATEIVKHMNIDPSISYKSSTFTSDDSSKNGNITVTLSNNQALSIDVINLKNTESTNQASWKDQTKSDFIFGPSGKQVTGSLTITNGKATLDLASQKTAFDLVTALNPSDPTVFDNVVKDKIQNISSSKIKTINFSINNSDKKTGDISLTLDNISSTVLKINVININAVTQTFKKIDPKINITIGDSTQLEFSSSGGSNAVIHIKNPESVTFDKFKSDALGATKSLYSQISGNIENNSNENPTLVITNNNNNKATITLTFVGGTILTINVDGLSGK